MRINARGGAIPPKHEAGSPRFRWTLRLQTRGLTARGRLEGFAHDSHPEWAEELRQKLLGLGLSVDDEVSISIEVDAASSEDAALRAVQALSAKWRLSASGFENVVADTGMWAGIANGYRTCADELDQALAASTPAQAESLPSPHRPQGEEP